MLTTSDDTIVAVSTPPGASVMGIVRLSGRNAFGILSKFTGRTVARFKNYPSYSSIMVPLRLSILRKPLQVSLYLMKAPYSYTKEDVAEVHTWGLPYLLDAVVNEFIAAGARLAEPGEFTKRAFLNGRIDLAQAESVISVINAKNEAERRHAVAGLGGRFSGKIRGLAKELLDLVSVMEVDLDFSDQDIETVSPGHVKKKLKGIIAETKQALLEYSTGQTCAESLKIAIIGRTNAGKSSLFNRLVRERRNIVSRIAGTTRDAIDHTIKLNNIFMSVYDTAGIRKPRGRIEEKSINAAYHVMDTADVVLLVIDGSTSMPANRAGLLRKLSGKKCIVVMNKSDLRQKTSIGEVKKKFGGFPVVSVSARTGKGIKELESMIAEEVSGGCLAVREFGFVANTRQKSVLRNAVASMKSAMRGLDLGMEFAAADVRGALDDLYGITGETTAPDILDNIFSRFCIGK